MLSLCCPRCKAGLSEADDAYACAGCGVSWPRRERVPSFVPEDYVFDGHRPELRALVTLAREQGLEAYRVAAEASRDLRGVARQAFDLSKADGRLLLDATRESVVLDVGCGFGPIAFALARSTACVYAVDPTLERAQFVQVRCEAEGVTNVVPIHAGVFDLPFSGAVFDLVVMNGVLEWVPASVPAGRPRDVQVRALRAITALLKPGGQFYLAIENRFGSQFLSGHRDHGGCRYTSVLPRWAASVLSLLWKGHRYRTYTYTYPGYLRLFRDAGLTMRKVYAACPDYRKMRRACELDDLWRLRDAPWKRCSRAQRRLIAAGLALRRPWLFVPAYVFILTREGPAC